MPQQESIVIIAPCFNEELVIDDFLTSLEKVLEGLHYNFEVIIVDDASNDGTRGILNGFDFKQSNTSLTILGLDFNQGHQQAIFQGLVYAKTTKANRFIVLDSDGQDDVNLIPEMLKTADCEVIHVNRKKRKESLSFRTSYHIYKVIFKLITGKSIHFGNYCLISRQVLNAATITGFVHFPAFISMFSLRKKHLLSNRLKREKGSSKMTFVSLLNHAIKSFIQYSERLLMVCLWVFVILAIALILFAGYVLYKKLFTDQAILGWASTVVLGLFNGTLISLSAFVIGTQLLKISHGFNTQFRAQVVRKNSQNETR